MGQGVLATCPNGGATAASHGPTTGAMLGAPQWVGRQGPYDGESASRRGGAQRRLNLIGRTGRPLRLKADGRKPTPTLTGGPLAGH